MNQKILSFCAAIVAITSAFGVVMAATPVIDLGHNYAFSEGVSDGGWGEYYKGWQIVEMEDYAEDSYGGGSPWVFNYGVDQHDPRDITCGYRPRMLPKSLQLIHTSLFNFCLLF